MHILRPSEIVKDEDIPYTETLESRHSLIQQDVYKQINKKPGSKQSLLSDMQ